MVNAKNHPPARKNAPYVKSSKAAQAKAKAKRTYDWLAMLHYSYALPHVEAFASERGIELHQAVRVIAATKPTSVPEYVYHQCVFNSSFIP